MKTSLSKGNNEIASVQFLKWTDLYLTEKPFQLFFEIDTDCKDQRLSNLQFEEKVVAIENIRGYESSFELDSHGFIVRQFSKGASSLQGSIISKENVVSRYFPAVDQLLRKEVQGVDRTFLLDWRVRSANPTDHEQQTTIDLLDLTAKLKPANYAHIDQSQLASINHVLREFPNEAEYLLSGRVRIINLWLPLHHTVEDWPLALCDGSTVSLQDDLVETDTVRRNYQGANMYMIHREGHKWYFLGKQQVDEVLIFKQFDTKETQAEFCPHVSFQQNHITADAFPRTSIEMRVIVFTNPE